MKFVPDVQSIKSLVERRLIAVDGAVRKTFPQVLQQPSLSWISFGDESLLGILFVTDSDMQRVRSYQQRKLDPFPGLFTTDPTLPAAFGFEKSRFNVVQGCGVKNSISFSIGKDCTFVVVDHAQEIDTAEAGPVSYKLPLGYFVSFGNEITPDNAYQNLDELIAYSVKTWAERQPPP